MQYFFESENNYHILSNIILFILFYQSIYGYHRVVVLQTKFFLMIGCKATPTSYKILCQWSINT
jgi:hypothetical protein